MIQSQNTIDREVQRPTEKPVQIFTEKDIARIQVELLKRVIKIHADSYSRGGFRVVIHNLICEIEGTKGNTA